MAALDPDLSQCSAEPIRVPGAIQPHGRMLVVDASTNALAAFSANWPGAASAGAAAASVAPLLAPLPSGTSPFPLGRSAVDGATWQLSAHRTGDWVIVEFEPAGAAADAQAPIYTLARDVLPTLQQAATLPAICELAVREMKALTGYGRCLIYRFDDEGHGEVLAESADDGYVSYAGHHFPAGDIPAQARALYLANPIRVIPTANYEPVPLLCVSPSLRADGIDLSQASLRSVSPVHLEYMRNMGTLASMSVSVVVGGRLWGLISCHDHEPRGLALPVRVACEHLGRLVSMQIGSREETAQVSERLALRQLMLALVSSLSDSDATLQHLVEHPRLLLGMARAGGAAVVLNDTCWTVGDTPGEAAIQGLAEWVAGQDEDVLATDRLAQAYPAAAALQDVASGLLAVSISRFHRHLILWFRPEVVRTIRWAGEPVKGAPAADGRIHPRLSFASWREQVGGRSLAWSDAERGAAQELRQALIGIVLRRVEEIAEVATELSRVNKELEAFSYTVSHDLRAPMRHIAGYVDLVIEAEGDRLSERALRHLSNVKGASAFAGQLVDALLDFSRMGRSALKRREVDTQGLVQDLVREMRLNTGERDIQWKIDPGLPVLWADAFLMQVVIRNMLSNAVKYTRGRSPAVIEVQGLQADGTAGLSVRDNGVGFQMKYVGKLFGVFQRLHQADEFEGTGIGLATMRRIVERHGGTVRAEGELDQGATFSFSIPTRSAVEAMTRQPQERPSHAQADPSR